MPGIVLLQAPAFLVINLLSRFVFVSLQAPPAVEAEAESEPEAPAPEARRERHDVKQEHLAVQVCLYVRRF